MYAIRRLWLLILFAPFYATADATAVENTRLQSAINTKARTDSSQRDQFRHPYQTLTFFEVQPEHRVVEIWPGAAGWYTEILAPYLRESGKLYAAQFNADSSSEFFRNARQQFITKIKQNPGLYGKVEVTTFDPAIKSDIAPVGSVDRVLTFRNVHNWYMRGGGDARVLAAFKAFYAALKPGGILGVVDHRLPESRNLGDMESSGYLKQSYVIKIAEQAGFKLLASSEINANAKDTADHPEGVWTLPPTLRLGGKDSASYLAIGESDRMTLKFVKPGSE